MRRRTKRASVAAAVVLVAAMGGAVAVGVASNAPVASTDIPALGGQSKLVSSLTTLTQVSAVSDGGIGNATVPLGKHVAASEIYRLASSGGVGVDIMAQPDDPSRVCLASTSLPRQVLCTEKANLSDGRVEMSIPTTAIDQQNPDATPRVDFFIVPDNVVSATTSNGTAAASGNVIAVSRPNGGPIGTITYNLSGGGAIPVVFGP